MTFPGMRGLESGEPNPTVEDEIARQEAELADLKRRIEAGNMIEEEVRIAKDKILTTEEYLKSLYVQRGGK